MARVEPELIIHRKENFLMSSGEVIVVEVKLQKLVGINKFEYPEECKINWIAFNKAAPQKLVRIDNYHNKVIHCHYNGNEEFISWESLEKTWKLFHQKIIERFGNFEKTLQYYYMKNMKSKIFIFKYDSESSMERLFTDLQQGCQGKLKSVEPNVIRSN